MEAQYVTFVDKGYATDEKVTRVWEVRAATDNCWLGHVKWYNQWRRYCFFPAPGASYDSGCLATISAFMAEKTNERKQAWTSKTKRARGE